MLAVERTGVPNADAYRGCHFAADGFEDYVEFAVT